MGRILFIGSNVTHYQESIMKGFINNGFDVYSPKYLEYKEVNRLIKFAYKNIHKRNFIKKQNTLYFSRLQEVKPDYVFIVNDYFMSTEFLEYCESKGIKILGYSLDAIDFCNEAMEGNNIYEHFKYYDAFYSYEPTDTRFIVKNGNNVKYLPLGFDASFFDRTFHNKSEYKYDIFFAGSLDKNRIEILNQVAKLAYENGYKMIVHTGIQLKKYNSLLLIPKIFFRQRKFKKHYRYLYDVIDNNIIPIDKISKLYANSKICINIHASKCPEQHTGPNPRTFETMAAGSLVFIDSGHVESVLEDAGKYLVEFGNSDDLLRKISYYMSNEQERLKLASFGFERAWSYYTQDNLVKQIIDNENII